MLYFDSVIILSFFICYAYTDALTGLCARTPYLRENVAKAPARMSTVWRINHRRHRPRLRSLNQEARLSGPKSRRTKGQVNQIPRVHWISTSSQAWWSPLWRFKKRFIISFSFSRFRCRFPRYPLHDTNISCSYLWRPLPDYSGYSGHVMQCTVNVYINIKFVSLSLWKLSCSKCYTSLYVNASAQ